MNTTEPRPEEPRPKAKPEEKVGVGVNIPADELAEMRRVMCVDMNGPAVLALARKGLAAEIAKEQR